MPERFAFVYESGVSVGRIKSVVADLKSAGLTLSRSPREDVALLDDHGEQSSGTTAEFISRADTAAGARALLWFPNGDSVYFRIRREDSIMVVSMSLKGCTIDEANAIASTLVKRFARESTASIGMILDPDGITEDVDWDAVFLGAGIFDYSKSGPPRVLGVATGLLDRVRNVPRHIRQESRGNVVMYTHQM